MAAFLAAAPVLFIAVFRTDNVLHHAQSLVEIDDYLIAILKARIALKDIDIALWASATDSDFDSGQQVVLMAVHDLKDAIITLVKGRPIAVDLSAQGFLESMVMRLDGLIKLALVNESSFAQARLTLLNLVLCHP